jgi:hypothetical protein
LEFGAKIENAMGRPKAREVMNKRIAVAREEMKRYMRYVEDAEMKNSGR